MIVREKDLKYSESILHSDTYLGEDFDDGLCHWKYLSKKVVNGKTVYQYNKPKKPIKRAVQAYLGDTKESTPTVESVYNYVDDRVHNAKIDTVYNVKNAIGEGAAWILNFLNK